MQNAINKKELKEQYKQIKHDMGVFMFKCLPSGKVYLGCGQNIKAELNSLKLQLDIGQYYLNSNLQNEWKKYGENSFEISIVEILKHDKDESKTDYKADLKILREMCSKQFDNFEFI